EARKRIVELAQTQGWFDGVDADRHKVPHGDRSKVAVEPFLTDQWYVDTSKIVQPAIDAVRSGETRILPEQDAKVYFHWLENIEPWCISRQLWWGHQIPVWYGPKKTEDGGLLYKGAFDPDSSLFVATELKTFCAATENKVLEMARKFYPKKYKVEISAKDRVYPDLGSTESGQTIIRLNRDPDVLDTWFSSAIWPIGTLGWPEQTPELEKYFPTSVLITGFDIIFFWVARMMMMQYAVVGQKPFSTVYVHALVRDEAGKKMSKSAGNVLDPLELIDEYGADAVRFTVTAMAAMGRDLKLSTSRIAGYRNFGTKLWNAMRYAEMNGVFDAPASATPPRNPSVPVNRWIIGEVAKAREEVDTALHAFRFNDAASALYAFVWGKVCDWYVEFSKPLLQGADVAAEDETRATMKWVLDQCLILLHPIMPFITEELWKISAARPKMLVHADWPTYQAFDLVDENADSEMNWVIALIDEVRSVRTQMHVPVGLRIPMLQIELDASGRTALANSQALIKRLARIGDLTPSNTMPKGAVTISVEGGVFALPLADIIDIAEEKARLEKALGKLGNDLDGLRKRLGNPKFVASAPDAVVSETRALLSLKEDETSKLRAALDRLEQLR
ncbi:MAG: class I tRNA ligase family protein, partial [Paracoccaceae bacterium]